MRRFSFLAIVSCAVTIGGCTKPAPKAAETATGEIIPQAAPVVKTLTLAEFAGKWNISARPEWNDTLTTHLLLNATGDPSTWTISYPPNPKVLPVQNVTFSGDSLVFDWGPYMSARKKGLKATSHETYRLVDGKIVGTSLGHYLGTPADSVLRLRIEGTRAP